MTNKLNHRPATEDEFVRAAGGMVQHISMSVWKSHGRRGDLEDVRAYGMMGALIAYREWDENGGRDFARFVAIGVRNACLNGVRRMLTVPRAAYRTAMENNLALGAIVAEASQGEPMPCPEAEAIRGQQITALRAAILRLPRKQGDVIRQIILGASHQDVATAQGKSRGAVSTVYANSIESLRRLMGVAEAA